jgi:hypothetical protein
VEIVVIKHMRRDNLESHMLSALLENDQFFLAIFDISGI